MLRLPPKTVIGQLAHTYYSYESTYIQNVKGGMHMTDNKPKARPAQHGSTLLELLENVIAAQFEMEKTAT